MFWKLQGNDTLATIFSIFKTIIIIAVVIFLAIIIWGIIDTVKGDVQYKKQKRREAEAQNEAQKKLEQDIAYCKARFPLTKPVKVHIDLDYADSHQSSLSKGLNELIDNGILDGYVTRLSDNTLIFTESESDNYTEGTNITAWSSIHFLEIAKFLK